MSNLKENVTEYFKLLSGKDVDFARLETVCQAICDLLMSEKNLQINM